MKKILTTVLISLFAFTGHAQTYWGSNTTSPMTNEAIDIEIDASGNQYVAGYISGGTSFATGVTSISSSGNNDIYVAKYDPSGAFLWVKKFGGSFSDKPTDLIIDGNQDILITGQYFGQVTFGSTILNSSANSKDIFIVKLNNSGTVVWAKSEGGSGSENAYGITTDNLNNVILTGQFQGVSSIAGQNLLSVTDPTLNSPNYDLFVSKYSPLGSPIWVKTGFAKYEERGFAVDCDSSNNIFITGQFSDTLTIAGQTINNNAYNVGFLAKFNPAGTLQWLHQMKAGVVLAYDLEVNSAGEIYLTGDFIGNMNYITANSFTTLTNSYAKRIFVIKTNNSGQIIWHRAFGSRNDVSSRSISVDNLQNAFITGYFKCDFSQFHDGATSSYNSAGFKDAYLIKVNSIGELVYTKTFGGQKEDQGHGVAILSSQLPVIAGSYEANLFIPSSATSSYSTGSSAFQLHNNLAYNFVNLQGDNSPNSFITNALHFGTPNFNFFNGQPTDSLFGHIYPNTDTLDICHVTTLSYLPQTVLNPTYAVYGPLYNYQWSNGSTNQYTQVSTTGTYIVNVEREDGCSVGGDTIVVIHHNAPPLPLLTDDHGLGLNTPNYPYYIYCAPETIGIEFSNLCAGCTIQVGSAPTYTDTLMHYYSQSGIYQVSVNNSFCSTFSQFTIELQNPQTYDTILPYLSFVEDYNHDDSIILCNNQTVHINVYDFYTNPTEILDSFNIQPLSYDYLISPQIFVQSGVDHYHYSFQPTVSGWYSFDFQAVVGYNNLCGVDTIMVSCTDSIYISINTLQIEANDLLCPDGSVYLYIDTVLSNMLWSGPGIEWTSNADDSIQVSLAGNYQLNASSTDTLNGCVGNFTMNFLLIEKVPPIISMNPADGIICPGDSVTFSIPNIYLNYEWINPDGFSISTSNTAHDGDQGFYYCHVTDSSGCILTTLPVELTEFTSPSLNVLPSNVICDNESVTINVSYDGNASITWIDPAWAGNSDVLTTNQIGTYICAFYQCGLNFVDSIQILGGSFSINLSVTDTILCFGDTSILTTNPGYSQYLWSNGIPGTPVLNVTEAGSYSVTVISQYGCEAQSDTVIIASVPFSFPPAINDTVVCIGDDINLEDGNGTTIIWYDSNFNQISTSTNFQILNLQEDSTVLAAYDVVGCSPAFQFIEVNLAPPLATVQLIGDTILCFNTSSNLSLSLVPPTVEWYLDGSGPTSGPTFTVNANPNPQNISVYFSNECYSDSLDQWVYTFPASTISIIGDTLIVCGNSNSILETDSLYDTIVWTSNLGLDYTDILQFDPAMGTGYVFVYGIDSNFCATNLDSIWVLYSDPTFQIAASAFNCYGDSVELTFTASSSNLSWTGPTFSTSSNNITILVDSTNLGWITIQATDSLACTFSDSIELTLLPLPDIILPYDTILCLNDWISYSSSTSGNQFIWQGLQPGDSLPVIGSSWYNMVAVNSNGCSVYDSIYVEAINCTNNLPNVFSPNGDGINDFYVIDEAILFPNNELIITNRWGDVVFQKNGYQNNWNGDNLVDGVYFVTFSQDRTDPNARKFQSFIHILR